MPWSDTKILAKLVTYSRPIILHVDWCIGTHKYCYALNMGGI